MPASHPPKVARLSLILSAVAFGGAGLAFLAAPGVFAPAVDLALPTPTARGDVRAVFGGLELGLGVFFALAARRAAWVRPGLVAQALAFGGLAAGRLLSLTLDGPPRVIGLALWAPELAGLALALWLLRRGAVSAAAPA